MLRTSSLDISLRPRREEWGVRDECGAGSDVGMVLKPSCRVEGCVKYELEMGEKELG